MVVKCDAVLRIKVVAWRLGDALFRVSAIVRGSEEKGV